MPRPMPRPMLLLQYKLQYIALVHEVDKDPSALPTNFDSHDNHTSDDNNNHAHNLAITSQDPTNIDETGHDVSLTSKLH